MKLTKNIDVLRALVKHFKEREEASLLDLTSTPPHLKNSYVAFSLDLRLKEDPDYMSVPAIMFAYGYVGKSVQPIASVGMATSMEDVTTGIEQIVKSIMRDEISDNISDVYITLLGVNAEMYKELIGIPVVDALVVPAIAILNKVMHEIKDTKVYELDDLTAFDYTLLKNTEFLQGDDETKKLPWSDDVSPVFTLKVVSGTKEHETRRPSSIYIQGVKYEDEIFQYTGRQKKLKGSEDTLMNLVDYYQLVKQRDINIISLSTTMLTEGGIENDLE